MPDVTATPVSLKCKICGGDIVNDYLGGSCVCANCGNKWALADLVPDYTKYAHVISKINRANELMAGEPSIESVEQARLLYQGASSECTTTVGPITADIVRICQEGQANCEKIRIYIKGKKEFDKKSYGSAMNHLKKVPGYKDADSLIEQCKIEIEKGKKKRIPLAVIVGLILPLALSIILKEFAGFPIWAVISIFLATSAGAGFLVYRGGAWAIVIEILSFLAAVPLILFMILAYLFHVPPVPSGIIAIAAPLAVIIAFAILVERKT